MPAPLRRLSTPLAYPAPPGILSLAEEDPAMAASGLLPFLSALKALTSFSPWTLHA